MPRHPRVLADGGYDPLLRQRAFVWTATAPAAQFPQYDAAFDQVVAGLIPALPEG